MAIDAPAASRFNLRIILPTFEVQPCEDRPIFNVYVTPSRSRHDPSLRPNIEAMGVESLWMGEHVVLFDKTSNPYPGSRDGKLPVPDGGGMLDTVATFGFIAGCTSTLRLGTGITLLPQRNPIYTAKEFTTLDWLSRGRIDFGIGVGWCQEEVEACGYSFHDRGARCDEFIEVIQKLWTDPVVNFEGKTIQLKDCRMDPKPVQSRRRADDYRGAFPCGV